MSKSRKLPIYKDGLAKEHRLMRRRIRRSIKLKVKNILSLIDKDIYDIPNSKSIVNDWDWSDYKIDFREWLHPRFKRLNQSEEEFIKKAKENINKASRK